MPVKQRNDPALPSPPSHAITKRPHPCHLPLTNLVSLWYLSLPSDPSLPSLSPNLLHPPLPCPPSPSSSFPYSLLTISAPSPIAPPPVALTGTITRSRLPQFLGDRAGGGSDAGGLVTRSRKDLVRRREECVKQVLCLGFRRTVNYSASWIFGF